MNNKVVINGRKIGEDEPVYVIAEMSANHLHDINRAKRIIKETAMSGADAIKLQTYLPETMTLNCHTKEFMATPGSPWEGMNLYDLYKEAYTPWEWHKELKDYAEELGIVLFSSPFDCSAVDFLERLDVPAYKIASFEIVDIPLIKKVASTGKPIIMSTGIAEISDIQFAVDACLKENNSNIILLKCVSEYPTPYEEINLATISNMKETFSCPVGLSDHSLGSCVAVAAVAFGACVIEKHITLKRADGGPDCSFSMEPHEFRCMVEDIRNVKKAIGTVNYKLTDRQKKSRERGRSIYVSKDIKKGEIFDENNIKSIRPGYGLHPKYYDVVIGKKAAKNLKMGEALCWEQIEQ